MATEFQEMVDPSMYRAPIERYCFQACQDDYGASTPKESPDSAPSEVLPRSRTPSSRPSPSTARANVASRLALGLLGLAAVVALRTIVPSFSWQRQQKGMAFRAKAVKIPQSWGLYISC